MRQSYPTEEQMQEALELIAESVEDEREEIMFYNWLINNIPKTINYEVQQSIAEILQEIKEDEMEHNRLLRAMYRQLKGRDIPQENDENDSDDMSYPRSFIDGIEEAIKNEGEAMEDYRKIMAGMPNNSYRDQMFNMVTDELQHGILYNYIYTSILRS